MTEESALERAFGPSPFEHAKALVEYVYDLFPECPRCKSDEGYDFSGWFHDYVKCKDCNAKWEVSISTMKLVDSPSWADFETLRKVIGQEMPLDFWKNLKATDIQGTCVAPPPAVKTGVCPLCGHSNPASNRFCGQCGNALAEATCLCPRCHESNSAQANFCRKCGAELGEDQTRFY
jgi:hypothetical protein